MSVVVVSRAMCGFFLAGDAGERALPATSRTRLIFPGPDAGYDGGGFGPDSFREPSENRKLGIVRRGSLFEVRSGSTMPHVAAGTRSGQARYRTVTLISLVAAIAQVALGGVVRVTGSGDACPDWPLCHGQIIPPLDVHIWLEFTHRLAATAVGFLVVASLVLAWRHLRTSKAAIVATGASTLLVVAAAILGGLTVLSELSWWTRLIHLGLAELTVAGLAVAWLAGPPDDRSDGQQDLDIRVSRQDRRLAWAGLSGLLVAILFGSYMVGMNYGAACPSWPLCIGNNLPAVRRSSSTWPIDTWWPSWPCSCCVAASWLGNRARHGGNYVGWWCSRPGSW